MSPISVVIRFEINLSEVLNVSPFRLFFILE